MVSDADREILAVAKALEGAAVEQRADVEPARTPCPPSEEDVFRVHVFPVIYRDYFDRVAKFTYDAYKQGYNIATAHEIGLREARQYYSKGCVNGEIRREASSS